MSTETLKLVITRMVQIPEEEVNRKNLELPPNKENHVTENKPKQTNQTDKPNTVHSKKSTKVDTTQNHGSGGHMTQKWRQRQNKFKNSLKKKKSYL